MKYVLILLLLSSTCWGQDRIETFKTSYWDLGKPLNKKLTEVRAQSTFNFDYEEMVVSILIMGDTFYEKIQRIEEEPDRKVLLCETLTLYIYESCLILQFDSEPKHFYKFEL